MQKKEEKQKKEEGGKFFVFLLSKGWDKIVRISEVCDQSGDRVSKNDKIYNICSMRLKRVFR